MQPAPILVVDDDAICLTTLAGFLRRRNVPCVAAGSVAAADEALAAGPFSLIISDIQMPGNEGLAWLRRILALPATPPVVLVSGSADLPVALEATKLPIAGFLFKPIDFDHLYRQIGGLLTAHHRRQQLRSLTRELSENRAQRDHGRRADDVLIDQLLELCESLATETGARPSDDGTALAPWKVAVRETIGVIAETKHSFHSTRLGQLRRKLETLPGAS